MSGFKIDHYQQAWYSLAASDLARLVPVAKSDVPSLQVQDCLPSTNSYLWEQVRAGCPAGLAIMALEQTAGRGQRGRTWQSTRGGLYLSTYLAVEQEADRALPLTLATAWGLAATLRYFQVPVNLKWPNDLVVGQRKLGGILTETHWRGRQITQAVIGVGINWANPVPTVGINLQAIPEQRVQSLEQLTAIVLWGILAGAMYYQPTLPHPWERLRANYLALLTSLGQEITWQGKRGIIVGVSDRGNLQVQIRHTGDRARLVQLPPGSWQLGYGGNQEEPNGGELVT